MDPLEQFSKKLALELNLSPGQVDTEEITTIVSEYYDMWLSDNRDPMYVNMCVEAIYNAA